MNPATTPAAPRVASWKWLVCGLLLCASALLYMDRQTLPNVATRVTQEFALRQEQYGEVEMWFGYAFAIGAFLWGCVADRWSVRWLYPALVLAWSAMGFLTGLVRDFEGLLLCRTLLGFFEAGHWPCALKTTQRLLARDERTLGNSVLQSGASIGAVLTPLVMRALLADRTEPGVWRQPFLIIGASGVLWVGAWFVLLKERDFVEGQRATDETPSPKQAGSAAGESFLAVFRDRRFWALIVVVIAINCCWQLVRAWLPKSFHSGTVLHRNELHGAGRFGIFWPPCERPQVKQSNSAGIVQGGFAEQSGSGSPRLGDDPRAVHEEQSLRGKDALVSRGGRTLRRGEIEKLENLGENTANDRKVNAPFGGIE